VMDGLPVDRLAEIRARSITDHLGVASSEPLYRLPSVTNEVWTSGELVLRVNRRADGRLTDEVAIAERLPDAIGYPEIIDSGNTDGWEWMATRRLPGVALSRVWPRISDAERAELATDLAGRLRLLHQTEIGDLSVSSAAPQLVDFSADDPLAGLREQLTRAYQLDHVPKSLIVHLAGMVEEAAPHFVDRVPTTLVHGDLTFENLLYHDGSIQAILDFEWARPAPRDLDLDVLLRFVCFPKLHVAADYEALTTDSLYRALPRRLEAAYPELFAHPHLFSRLVTYSIGFDVHQLLSLPPTTPDSRLGPAHPLQRLMLTAEGRGHLHQLTGG